MAVTLSIATLLVMLVAFVVELVVSRRAEHAEPETKGLTEAQLLAQILAQVKRVGERDRRLKWLAFGSFAALVIVQCFTVLDDFTPERYATTQEVRKMIDDQNPERSMSDAELRDLANEVASLSRRMEAVEKYLWGDGFRGDGDTPPPPPVPGGLNALLMEVGQQIEAAGENRQAMLQAILKIVHTMRLPVSASATRPVVATMPTTRPAELVPSR